MLSEKEKHGIAELLGRMAAQDLYSLAQTVTLRLVVPDSPSEAVASIILHTDRAADLLRRRKVKKDFLFKYLHDRRVEGVEATSDKSVIVAHVLQLWESSHRLASLLPPLLPLLPPSSSTANLLSSHHSVGSVADEDSLPEAPAPSRNTSYSSLCSLDLYNNAPNHPPNLALILNRSHSTSSGSLLATAEEGSGGGGGGGTSHLSLRRSESNWSFMDDSNDGMAHSAMPATASAPAPSNTCFVSPLDGASGTVNTINGTVTANITSHQAQEMADTFVKWYYELINSKSSDFRPDHFFPDASAKICLQSSDQSEPPEFIQVQNSGQEVCTTLFDIALKYKLTYNPNLCRDGVTGAIDPHGLVIVNACGTLHNAISCCGTFQQQFGLVRDPREGNNWKIKFTNASLVSKSQAAALSNGGLGDGGSQVNSAAATSSSSAMALS